jgi:hypothetical protein
MDRGALQEEVFIPVAVDAEREIEGVQMVRATYFVVRTNAPMAFWELELPPLASLHGVGAIGIAGVVYGALREGGSSEIDLFSSSRDIGAVFALEAEGLPLSVDLEDVWIPKLWIVAAQAGDEPTGDSDDELARGEVFRVALPVFQQVYRYTAGDLDLTELLGTEASGQVHHSPEETDALYAWSAEQIEITRQAFPSKTVKLRYREQTSA